MNKKIPDELLKLPGNVRDCILFQHCFKRENLKNAGDVLNKIHEKKIEDSNYFPIAYTRIDVEICPVCYKHVELIILDGIHVHLEIIHDAGVVSPIHWCELTPQFRANEIMMKIVRDLDQSLKDNSKFGGHPTDGIGESTNGKSPAVNDRSGWKEFV